MEVVGEQEKTTRPNTKNRIHFQGIEGFLVVGGVLVVAGLGVGIVSRLFRRKRRVETSKDAVELQPSEGHNRNCDDVIYHEEIENMSAEFPVDSSQESLEGEGDVLPESTPIRKDKEHTVEEGRSSDKDLSLEGESDGESNTTGDSSLVWPAEASESSSSLEEEYGMKTRFDIKREVKVGKEPTEENVIEEGKLVGRELPEIQNTTKIRAVNNSKMFVHLSTALVLVLVVLVLLDYHKDRVAETYHDLNKVLLPFKH